MDYTFELAQASDLEQVYELIDRRIRWMDEVGIRQWNVTDYWGVYPKEHYMDCLDRGELYVMRRNRDGLAIGVAVLYESDERWADAAPANAYYVHHFATDLTEKGVGVQMLRCMETLGARQGKQFLRLDCSVDNPTLNSYYEEAGYRFAGYCMDGVYHGTRREKRLTVSPRTPRFHPLWAKRSGFAHISRSKCGKKHCHFFRTAV